MKDIRYVHRALSHLALEKGLTQKQLAERTGWEPSRISDLLGKEKRMRLDTLLKLLDALDSDLSGLGAWIEKLKEREKEESMMLWDVAEHPAGSLEAIALRRRLLKLAVHLQDALSDIESLLDDTISSPAPEPFQV